MSDSLNLTIAIKALDQASATIRAISDALKNGMGDAAKQASHLASTSDSATSRVVSGLKDAAGGVLDFGAKLGQAVIGVQGLAQGAMGLASALLAPNASMEQTKIGFETLLGKGKATDDFLKDLSAFAASTPFEFPELATNAQHMLAFGFTANEVLPTLTDIGDAMSAMGKGSADIDRVVTVFGQMKAAGRANAGDMMQLTTMGIPAWKYLAEAMHLTIPEVQDLSSKGLIPAQTAIDALTKGMHGMFGGGMAAQATTFNGLMSTLQDNAGAAMRAFTGPLFVMAKDSLTQLGNLVSSPRFQQFATMLGEKVGGALQIVGQFIATTIVPAFQRFFEVVAKVWPILHDEGLGMLIASLQNLAGAVGEAIVALSPLGTLLGSVFTEGNAVAAAQGLVTAFYQLSPIIDGVASGIRSLTAFFQSNSIQAQIVKDLLIGVGVALAAIRIGLFLATLPALIAGFITWATTAGGAAVATFALFWPLLAIIAVIALVVAGVILLVTHWSQVASFLQGVWGAVSSWFMGMLSALGAFFARVWQGIVSGLQAAWNAIVNAVRVGVTTLLIIIFAPIIAIVALFAWLYQHNTYFKMMIDAIVAAVRIGIAWLIGAWQAAIAWLVGAWQWIVGFASAVWANIVAQVQAQISALVAILMAVWSFASSWLTDRWNELVGMASAAWSAVSSVFGGIWDNYIAGPLGKFWGSLTDWFGKLGRGAVDAGKNFIKMLADNITSGAGRIWDAVVGIADTIWKALGFHSPAEAGPGADADRWMPNLISMLSSGLTAGAPQIQAAAMTVAQPLTILGNPATTGHSSPSVSTPRIASNSSAVTINLTINAPARSRNEAQEIAKTVMDELSRELRRSGNLVTWTSGGRAS